MTDTEWSERIDQAISEYPEVGEYLEAIRGNVEALASRLAAVEKLHQGRPNSVSALYPTPLCSCGEEWPCDTIKAARGE